LAHNKKYKKMAELSISQLIKIIIGVLVFVAVVLGVYMFFKNNIISFFENVFADNSSSTSNVILNLIKLDL